MNRRSGSFRSPTGQTLHTLSWQPEAQARAAVVIAHGYGEHAGRYGRLAAYLAERAVAVHALDFAGHGRSAGRRGVVPEFDGLVHDLASFTEAVREGSPQLPVGLFAHSMGGAVAATLLERRPEAVDALALSSPYVGHGRPVPAGLHALVRRLARVAPLTGTQRVATRDLSRVRAAVEAYRRDPLVFHGRVPAVSVIQMFQGFRAVQNAHSLVVPLLVVIGDADRIADPRAAVALFERAASADKELEVVPGGFHELLNDLPGDLVLARVGDWLVDRLFRTA